MSFDSFEDIKAWQKARGVTLEIYNLLDDSKDFGYKNQIQRCAVSIMNNIAEGFERKSDKDFRRFLYIAKGSCGELRSMLTLGKDLGYFSKQEFEDLYHDSVEISRMLSGLIKQL